MAQVKILNSVIYRDGVGGNAINTYSYQYDKNHNIQSVSEEVNGEETAFSFSYDALNRIYTSGEHNETYTYDPRGNRKTLETDKPFEIDAVQYHYNLWNELVQVVKEDGTTVSYTYDPDGLLYERTVDAEPTTRYYQFTGQIIAEGEVTPNDSAVLKARYVRGIGLIHREDSLGNKQYYLTNGHGDIVELRDETGGIVNQYDYDIWGNPEILADGVENPFLYSGEYWDQEVELQYLRARWYDPSMGRFINEDTYEGELGNPLTLNLYTYTANNPLIYIDPSGNMWAWVEDAWQAVKDQAEVEWEAIKQTHSSWENALSYYTLGFSDPFYTSYRVPMNSKEYWMAQGEVVLNTVSIALTGPGGSAIKQGAKTTTSAVTRAAAQTIQTSRVGQWMSKAEYESFMKNGQIPRTNVLTKGKEGYMKQANKGDYYVEFDINSTLLVTKDSELGWSLVKSKNQMYIKLAENKGQVLPDPVGTNIKHVFTKT